ncbi:MAG: hypothetical protein EP338_05895 [Bacteroidetes bacterium]|nr:MAG: hypothetical protein EP338_05895 [Bacteroidota bacterium]
MKRIMSLAAVAALSIFCFSFANAQNNLGDNQLIGIARGAAHECLQDYQGNFYSIGANVETVGICFVEGFLKKVTFYAGPNCMPNQPCPSFPTVPVAEVLIDCDNKVISVTCL